MAEIATAEPKYTPRTAAADFVKGLPQLGVEQAPPVPAAAAPATAPPAVPPATPVPAAAPAEEKIPRTAKDWDAYRAANKKRADDYESKIGEMQKKIEEYEKAPKPGANGDDPRVTALQKEIDDYSERLRLVDITQHPKFKAFYDGKVNAQIELAKRIVGADHADAIGKLLAMPDNEFRQEKIEAILGELSTLQQARVGSVLNTLTEIETEKTGHIEQAKTDLVAMQEKKKVEAETAKTEGMKKAEAAFATVLSTVQNPKDKDSLFIFQKQEGNEEWNKGVDDRIAYGKNLLFGQTPPQDLIKAALHAAALPGVVKSYQIALEKIKTLETQVAGLTASTPKLEGGRGGDKPAGEKPAPGKTRFLDGRGQAAGWVKDLNETASAE